MLNDPVRDRSREVVFADEGLPDDVAVCERGGRVLQEVLEVDGLVLDPLDYAGGLGGELLPRGYEVEAGGWEMLFECGDEEGLHVFIFIVDEGVDLVVTGFCCGSHNGGYVCMYVGWEWIELGGSHGACVLAHYFSLSHGLILQLEGVAANLRLDAVCAHERVGVDLQIGVRRQILPSVCVWTSASLF